MLQDVTRCYKTQTVVNAAVPPLQRGIRVSLAAWGDHAALRAGVELFLERGSTAKIMKA